MQNLLTVNKLEETCKGQIFKYAEYASINARGHWRNIQQMMLQKRMSCKGCADCTGLTDLLHEIPYEVLLPTVPEIGCYYYLAYEVEEVPYHSCGDENVYPKFVKLKKTEIT